MLSFAKKLRLSLLLLLSFTLVTQQTYTIPNNWLIRSNTALFLAAVTYRWWFNPDRSFPTLDKLNIVTFLPIDSRDDQDHVISESNGKNAIINLLKKKEGIISIQGQLYKIYSGIPDEIKTYNEPIFLYSGGYSNAGHPYAFSAYNGIKRSNIQGPCIVFEYATDTRRAFNFCQEQDLHCVTIAYEEIIKKHSEARIILKGACKGAAAYLRFLAEKASNNEPLDNIKALIAESPPISVKSALKHIRNGGIVSHTLCRFTLPNYNPALKTIMDATTFPTNIPILLASLPHDTISDLSDMKDMKKHLDTLGADIEHFVSCGTTEDENGNFITLNHGKLGRANDYQKALNKFFIKHELRQEI